MESLEHTDPKDQDKVLDNFVQILAENNDIRLFDEITAEFHKLELIKKGIKQVELTSAQPLSRSTEQEIVSELNKLVKGKVEVRKKIDEQLIGGVLITIDDQMIDATVKNNLTQLKKDLTQ